MCEGNPEAEVPHSLLIWRMAKNVSCLPTTIPDLFVVRNSALATARTRCFHHFHTSFYKFYHGSRHKLWFTHIFSWKMKIVTRCCEFSAKICEILWWFQEKNDSIASLVSSFELPGNFFMLDPGFYLCSALKNRFDDPLLPVVELLLAGDVDLTQRLFFVRFWKTGSTKNNNTPRALSHDPG